jgi:hypothetical protein
MIRYVTMAYGGAAEVYRQSVMLLLSLVAHAPEPYELLVATDRPDCYVWFGTRIEIAFLDAGRLVAWRGPEPFSMRQKLELARFAASDAVSQAERLVLLDADVLATRQLDSFAERLRDGDLFMHKREYVLARSARRGNRKLWAAVQKFDRAGRRQERVFSLSSVMWNSGVLALPTSDRMLLDEALRLYDELGSAGVRHFATEQLVESVVFGRTGRLRPAEEWFVHYWGNKPGYDVEISRRLADAFIEGLSVKEAAARYREHPIELSAEVRPTRAQKVRRWLRA